MGYHPDKNPSDEARQKFNAVRDAYEVLSDPELRVIYDSGGIELLEAQKKGEVPEAEDIEKEVPYTLAEAYQGVEKEVKVRRRLVCRGCKANPKKRKNCKLCKQCPPDIRMEMHRRGNMVFQQQVEEPSKETCRMEETNLTVHIDRGMTHFDNMVFKHMASQKPGHTPGAVNVKFKEVPTKPFERSGNALMVPIEITLREALLGWERKIKHMDGHFVHVSTVEVTMPGQVLVVKREGMPVKDVPDEFGDLMLKITVKFPHKLTSSDKEELANLNALNRDVAKQEL